MGPPGAGKSSIADKLWGPNVVQIEDRLPPGQWHDFLNEIMRLFIIIQHHKSIEAAIRMNNRSLRKIATVARMKNPGPYIQNALAQRGLGFGWRLQDMGLDINELRHYFRLMPVSIGVAVTCCPMQTIIERNREREKVPETAHENRAHMVPLMMPAIKLAVEVFHERNVPIVEIDTSKSVEDSRRQLVEFAGGDAFDPSASGPECEVAVLSPPHFWR